MTTTLTPDHKPKPCKHGRNFCMECHYDPQAPRSTLPEMYDKALAELAEVREKVDEGVEAYQLLWAQNIELRAELERVRPILVTALESLEELCGKDFCDPVINELRAIDASRDAEGGGV